MTLYVKLYEKRTMRDILARDHERFWIPSERCALNTANSWYARVFRSLEYKGHENSLDFCLKKKNPDLKEIY